MCYWSRDRLVCDRVFQSGGSLSTRLCASLLVNMGKHKYTLVYFNMRGAAEVSRLLFAQAGVEYEDKRYEREEWPKHKPEAPLGQVPYLIIDGVKLAQSHAIARYLAREFGLYGKTNMEGAKIDEILDTLLDFRQLVIKVYFGDENGKAAAIEQLNQKAPDFFKIFTRLLKENGGDYAVGKEVSLADFALYNSFTQLQGKKGFLSAEVEAELTNNETLMKHCDRVAALPRIAEWLKKRPVTEN